MLFRSGQLQSSSLLVMSTVFSRRTATVTVQFPVGYVHRLLKKDSYRDDPVPCWSCPPSSQEGQLRSVPVGRVHHLLKKDSYGPVPCWSCPPPSQEGQLRSCFLLVVSAVFSRWTGTVTVQFPVGCVHCLLKKDTYAQCIGAGAPGQ